MNRIDICKSIIQSVIQYITNTDVLEAHREKNHFIRNRKLSMFQVILYLLYSSKASMFQNLSSIRDDLFKELFYLSVDQFYSQVPSRKLWHGYHLFAIDGSKIELPNFSSNFGFFGEMFGYPDPSRRFTMGLASIVYDVLDVFIVHASFHRYLASERAAAIGHLKNLEGLGLYQDSVVIFDRGYYSENLFRYCVEHGHLCLMRLKDGYQLSKKCTGDTLSILHGDSKAGTPDLEIRVIKVTLDNGTKEYLATNLFAPSITQAMFQELYFYRWPVETKYKELKSRLALEEFSGATTVSVFQEFYINMLFSNLSSLIKNQADEEILISADSSNKHRYQANRAFVIGRLKKILPKVLCGIFQLSAIDQLFEDAIRCRFQILPGRTCRRKKSHTKGRTHFNNQKVAF